MSRTLEEILAYSRETGMDWELTAGEAGLLRREVDRLRGRVAEYEALDWPTCSGEWLSGSGGHRRHGPCGRLATWWHPADVFAYCDAHIVEHEKPRYWHVSTWRDQAEAYVTQLTSERERGAKADALMLEKMHGLERQLVEERASTLQLIRENAVRLHGRARVAVVDILNAIERGEAGK